MIDKTNTMECRNRLITLSQYSTRSAATSVVEKHISVNTILKVGGSVHFESLTTSQLLVQGFPKLSTLSSKVGECLTSYALL